MSKSTQNLSPLQELIAEQKLLCEEVGSAYVEVSGDDVVAVAVKTLDQDPIVGIRKKPETEENISWFIYGGEQVSNEDDFETMTVRELQDIIPDVLPYLALEQGFRFMIDGDDYEDVWKEDV
ncbi:immunity protein Imm33 domain-containing protein [Acinetobacter wanghuae]|uniref:immunity protein Imm33 domain-containing protein n=1 Tax=Acinetobacter wanghuae TaxID=2662362 RepID=UPI003AF8336C